MKANTKQKASQRRALTGSAVMYDLDGTTPIGIALMAERDRNGPVIYDLAAVPCPMDPKARAFALTKSDGGVYHVRLGGEFGHECECWGWLRWGRCKHVTELARRLESGELDGVRPAAGCGDDATRGG